MNGCRRDSKLYTAEEAVALVEDSQTVAISGFAAAGMPEALVYNLEQHFLNHGGPGDLTLIHAAGQGDGIDRGINHLAHEGLELIEVAPGIDLQTQVLDLLPFAPIQGDVRKMPAHVFE